MSKLKWAVNGLLALTLLAAAAGLAPGASWAASHREAPLIALDPTADITDFFMFRSYEAGQSDKLVLIMDVIPGEEPSSGPNYYNFDPNVLYAFNLDNDKDGVADDVRIEFKFANEFRGVCADLGLFLSYVAIPPITALDGAGSDGLCMRQRYSVTLITGGHKPQVLGKGLIAVPSNVGPRTMPNYGALVAQGTYDLGHGVRVFAGQRDDPFYIDLGGIFDTLNIGTQPTDMLSGFNVHTIAIELPISQVTADGAGPDDTHHPVLGAYANTSRRTTTVLRGRGEIRTSGRWVQVQRLANPLVNEAIIGTADKDRWNGTAPSDEAQFLDYYQNPRLAAALTIVFGADAAPLFPLDGLLLTYGNPGDHLSELLRLNVSVAPTPLAQQSRLTVLEGDNAGWPNGRRPIDDVTDIAIKVIGGTNYLGASDGVDNNDKAYPDTFPFIPDPWDGFNSNHKNVNR